MANTYQSPQSSIMQPATDPLAELRDIHQPSMIETWPPAPGWWLLAIIFIVTAAAILTKFFRHWRANKYRREAIKELDLLLTDWESHGDDRIYLTAVQDLLKRVALSHFPRDQVASLTGEAWVKFLDNSSGSHDFSIGEMELLIDGNYRPEISVNVEKIQSFASQWIQQHNNRFLVKTS